MENNVVTLETAKKLKAAGFPQTSAYMWREFKDGGGELQRRRGRQIGEFEFAAPTAQEIADQLPEMYAVKKAVGEPTYYTAWDWNMDDKHIDAPTMAEALAPLYLRLNGVADE
jgi:hypothetical protein